MVSFCSLSGSKGEPFTSTITFDEDLDGRVGRGDPVGLHQKVMNPHVVDAEASLHDLAGLERVRKLIGRADHLVHFVDAVLDVRGAERPVALGEARTKLGDVRVSVNSMLTIELPPTNVFT
jgi:hypothetical protein